MSNTNEQMWFDQPNHDQDRFRDGFIDGFVRAREIFWRDFMRKAGETRLIIEQMQETLGDGADNTESVQALAAMEAAYRNAADTVARSHTLYPGALSKDADPNDPRFTVRHDDNLFRY